jgi:hypothetical protein
VIINKKGPLLFFEIQPIGEEHNQRRNSARFKRRRFPYTVRAPTGVCHVSVKPPSAG